MKKKKSKVSTTAWLSHNQTHLTAEDAEGAEESLENLAEKTRFFISVLAEDATGAKELVNCFIEQYKDAGIHFRPTKPRIWRQLRWLSLQRVSPIIRAGSPNTSHQNS